ncbi:nuclear transport factor 2 family protein [Halopseudomonas xiamenensis]|uniref:nuclear transport factor 2 family protein n=1 Tax=Halopseudomonas xiamenensis TaxID=157792 RepID=UPI00162692F5|nr:nuclear transport factor 2 family protein [Halopseudomonas xiamenensis]
MNMPTSETLLAELATLLDKQQLHELNVRYCMGVDRRDQALLTSLWSESGSIDFGLFKGSARQFCELIALDNPAVRIAHHFASNELFEIQGDIATGQSYVIGTTVNVLEDGSLQDQLAGGRYLDTYIRDNGRWLFASRLFVIDWLHAQNTLADYQSGIAAAAVNGKSSTEDIAYRFYNKR